MPGFNLDVITNSIKFLHEIIRHDKQEQYKEDGVIHYIGIGSSNT